jgi:putative flippase GtrA
LTLTELIEPLCRSARLARIARFGIVGGAATVTHAAILWLLADRLDIRPSLATLFGFMTAFSVSYLGHYHFTFGSRMPHRTALPGFALAAVSGAVLNVLIFVIMTDVFRANYWLAFGVTILAVPPVVFMLSKGLAFERQPRAVTRTDYRLLMLPAAFFAVTAAYALIFHYHIPFYDHWDIVPLWDAAQSGTLKPEDLFVQHGSHWHATGYIVMLANAELTGMAHWPDVLVSLLLAAFGFVALFEILRRTLDELGEGRSLFRVTAAAAFIYFSLDQCENWLWGWQVSLFASTTGTVWCIALLMRPGLNWARLGLAGIAAAVAIYGFATAWCLLPIGLFLIALAPDATRQQRVMAGLAWTLLFAAFFAHFTATRANYTDTMLPHGSALETILGIGHYLANYLASAVARIYKPAALLVAAAALAGLAMVARLTWTNFRTSLSAYRGLGALLAFGLGAGLLTALGRWQAFGPEQAFSNRYITLSNNAWLSIIVAALVLLPKLGPKMRTLFVVALCGFALAKTANDASAINNARLAMRVNAAACQLALAAPDMPPEARAVIGAAEQPIAPHLRLLEARDASLFRPRAIKRCQSGQPAEQAD